MAMRMLPAHEFYEELKRRGLEPTDILIKSKTHRLWKDGRGWYISVPEHSDEYPDSVLDRILEQLDKLYHSPDEFK